MTATQRFEPEFLASAAGGELAGRPGGERVVTDTREPVANAIFLALTGPRFDGHDFVEDALGAGATGAVVNRSWATAARRATLPLCVVDDTLFALQELARRHRDRIRIPLVAVTGSSGKTTTKELIAAALSSLGSVHRTRGNYNNHIGLPLTLLGLDESHAAAVVEIGMNRPGEIALLSGIASPDVAVITNVSEAHLDGVGDRRGVAREKADIVAGLSPSGVLIHPHGDRDLDDALSAFAGRRRSFGLKLPADLHPDELETTAAGLLRLSLGGHRLDTRMAGEHTALNMLAAWAVAEALGADAAVAAEALSQVEPLGGRLKPITAGEIVILDDTYNANPASMKVALEVLRAHPARGRRWAVLGDMLELGEDAADLHRSLGTSVRFVDGLLTVGPLAHELGHGAEEAGLAPEHHHHVADAGEAGAVLLPLLEPGDVVLLKGSRGMRLELTRDMLITALSGEN